MDCINTSNCSLLLSFTALATWLCMSSFKQRWSIFPTLWFLIQLCDFAFLRGRLAVMVQGGMGKKKHTYVCYCSCTSTSYEHNQASLLVVESQCSRTTSPLLFGAQTSYISPNQAILSGKRASFHQQSCHHSSWLQVHQPAQPRAPEHVNVR